MKKQHSRTKEFHIRCSRRAVCGKEEISEEKNLIVKKIIIFSTLQVMYSSRKNPKHHRQANPWLKEIRWMRLSRWLQRIEMEYSYRVQWEQLGLSAQLEKWYSPRVATAYFLLTYMKMIQRRSCLREIVLLERNNINSSNNSRMCWVFKNSIKFNKKVLKQTIWMSPAIIISTIRVRLLLVEISISQ